MMQSAPTLTISTSDLPPTARSGAIRDYLQEMMRVDVTPLVSDSAIHYRAALRVVPGAAWGDAFSSAAATNRSASLTQDGSDDLMLITARMPMVVQPSFADEFRVSPGDTVLLSQARVMRMAFEGTGHAYSVRVNRRAVAQMVPRLCSAPVVHLPRHTPILALLWDYGRLVASDPLSGDAAQAMAGRHSQEMVALICGALPEMVEADGVGALGAVRLRVAQADIEAHLDNTNLDLDWVAARQKISVRYLQRLFARQGTSFSQVLRRARLERARSMLEDPRNRNRSILSIALECGFVEASAMNRAFRQAFGATPSEIRGRR